MFHSGEIASETCLIDGLEESFDLHFTRSSINHLSPDLKNKRQFFFFQSEDIREKSHADMERMSLRSVSSITRAQSA